MTTDVSATVTNWKGSIVSHPARIVRPTTVDEIVNVLSDPATYPSPVRAVGSNHSTTRCAVAEGGTVIDMTGMDRIIEITGDSVTVQAGALYIDVAKALEQRGLQFYVNVELGNLTVGSGSCGGTKDASMPGEFGQVASYAIGFTLVLPSGDVVRIGEEQPELLRIVRSSYGLLGIVVQVTFRVRPLAAMSVQHVSYRLGEFLEQLPQLKARKQSMMFFLMPFLDRVIVEYRQYHAGETAKPNRTVWRFRNWMWKTVSPGYGALVTKLMPVKSARYFLIDWFNYWVQRAMGLLLSSPNTSAADQIIRYPERAGLSAYTFSIWAFPEEDYPTILAAYYRFCRDYYRDSGYRCNLANVGYRIAQDPSSLFSYSTDGTVMTLDPVSTGDPGWNAFLDAYNDFCSEHGGVPLFNQTRGIRPDHARRAFGARLDQFEEVRRRYDPENRLLNDYFRAMLPAA